MKLTHKIFILSDSEGKPVKIDSVSDLMFVVNDKIAFAVKEKAPRRLPLIIDADMLEPHILEGYSILSSEMPDGSVLFKVASGHLMFEDLKIRFFDAVNKKDVFVKAVDEAILMYNFKKVDVQDQEVKRQIDFLRSFTIQQLPQEQEQDPQVTEEVKEEPKEQTGDQNLNSASEVNEEPKTETVTETKESDLSVKQLEDNDIPKAVLDRYSEHLNDFTNDGYKEFKYKNYRLLMLPEERTGSDRRGTDMFLLLLTPERVAQIKEIDLIDNASETIKYKFVIDKVKKTLYVNPSTGEMSVRRPKRGEKLTESTPVAEENQSVTVEEQTTGDQTATIQDDNTVSQSKQDDATQLENGQA